MTDQPAAGARIQVRQLHLGTSLRAVFVLVDDAGVLLPPEDPVGFLNTVDAKQAAEVLRARYERRRGSYPYGYHGVGPPRHRYPVPDDGEQRVLEEMRRLRRRGLSYAEVAEALNDTGLLGRRQTAWTKGRVQGVLRWRGPDGGRTGR